jgi:PAS domain S-box-containing protein
MIAGADDSMNRLFSISIRAQLFLLILIVAIPAIGIIIYSGMKSRNDAIADARRETYQLVDKLTSEQQNLVSAAEQLLITLAQLPDVRNHQTTKVQPILRRLHRLNAWYSNIYVADQEGNVWAQAVDAKPFSISDRRYFLNARASGRFSSGEYVLSRATGKTAFNFAYPMTDERGVLFGVVNIGIKMPYFEHILEHSQLTPGTRYILIDHRGVILGSSTGSEKGSGKPYDPELFRIMKEGPEVSTFQGISNSGDPRIITYRKLRLPGEQIPYIYIQADIPLGAVLSKARKELLVNIAILTSVLLVAVAFAWLIGKRSIADRLTVLERASESLAKGDLQVRVSELVAGGEMGRLGQSFDHMADRLAVRERDLRASEEEHQKLISVIEMSRDMIGMATLDGKVAYMNNAGLALVGLESREEACTKTILEFFVESTFQQALEKILPAIMKEGFWRGETRLRNFRTGIPVDLEMAAFVITDPQGAPIAIATVSRDITERKNAEEERQRLQSQLIQAQKMESIGQLAGGVAHDFNNILTAIIGYGSILQLKMAAHDPLRTNVDQILESAGRAANLTNSLLAFSRKQVLNVKPIHLNGIIAGQEQFLRRIIGEDIEMRTILRGDAVIMADRGQIEQVLMNLATNARDAMPKGGHLTVETDLLEITEAAVSAHGIGAPGTYAVISVTDTGLGMDEEAKQKIFEPFFTTKEVGRGTGLGMAIVYGIVKQHKGYVTVDSQVGKGATFKIYLPLHRGQVEQKEKAPAVSPGMTGTETILLAEDDATLRTFFRNILTDHGYTVVVAEHGEEAIRKFAERKDEIQLMVVDMIMPKKSGREVFDAVQAMKPGTKVIFSSGYTADKVRREGLPAGSEFIAKPASPQEYLKKIREVLDSTVTP